MKRFVTRFTLLGVGMLALVAFTGCETEDSGNVSGSVYYGAGYYDSWYYGGYYDDPDLIVTPPDKPSSPPQPTHPIANPPAVSAPRPTPMPSIPSTPRPSFRR